MTKSTQKKKRRYEYAKRGTINLRDPERLARIRQVFADRNVVGLSLSAMVRNVFEEWLTANSKASDAA